MAYEIFIIGIGPGSVDYILPLAVKTVERCTAIVGGKRALQLFSEYNGKTCLIAADLHIVAAFIEKQVEFGDVGVLVSGDPGFYSLLTYLRTRFAGRNLQVIPGISSVQLAFARLTIPWNDGCLASLHGRESDVWIEYLKYKKPVGLLTDRKYSALFIRKTIEGAGITDDDIEIYVCSDLSYEEEKILKVKLENIEDANYTNAVVVIIPKLLEIAQECGGEANA